MIIGFKVEQIIGGYSDLVLEEYRKKLKTGLKIETVLNEAIKKNELSFLKYLVIKEFPEHKDKVLKCSILV